MLEGLASDAEHARRLGWEPGRIYLYSHIKVGSNAVDETRRRPGAARPGFEVTQPGLTEALRWTCKSRAHLAAPLVKDGWRISSTQLHQGREAAKDARLQHPVRPEKHRGRGAP